MTPDPKPISVLKLQLYDSYYFKPISNSNSASNIHNNNSNSNSSNFKNYNKNVNEGFKNKHYSPLHDFIYRTPLNFLS